ncbi:hypothetical protein [Cerasicoccus fimbriatus]|uniref:hypothetical protein n=1 Tax=Cerasicoccus fimbriatus TaxID=3014554 RepID=UPI0022B2FF4F|nr:hypothetical protein [Cerasicoccus sp. TK19100]
MSTQKRSSGYPALKTSVLGARPLGCQLSDSGSGFCKNKLRAFDGRKARIAHDTLESSIAFCPTNALSKQGSSNDGKGSDTIPLWKQKVDYLNKHDNRPKIA